MPVAYALGLAAILGALWIDIPLEAVMLKISDGTDDFALLAIPFFVLAGAIMAEGGMAVRLVNLARVFVGAIRGGLALVNVLACTLLRRHLRLVGRRHRVDRLGDDPADGQAGYPQRLRHQRDDLRLGAGAADPAVAQRGASIRSPPAARSRSRTLFLAGMLPGLLFGAVPDRPVPVTVAPARLPEGRAGDAARRPARSSIDALWGLVTVVIILGGILSGVFTPTESAAVACVYAFLVTMFVYRDYQLARAAACCCTASTRRWRW